VLSGCRGDDAVGYRVDLDGRGHGPGEQGIDVSFAQFRGFIAPGGISEETEQFWIDAGMAYADSDAYTEYVESNYLQPNAQYGDEFGTYLGENTADLEKVFAE